jgi:RNA polymerase sigma factor (sigma-70 family)
MGSDQGFPEFQSSQAFASHDADDGPRIVVVEEDEALARALVRALKWKRFRAQSVSGVAETNEIITRVRPSLIVLDVIRSDHFLETGVDTKQLKTVPVLMLSSYISSQIKRRAIHSGVDAFLVKPFLDLDELFDLVSALLIRSTATAQLVDKDPLDGVFERLARDYRFHIESLVRRNRGAEEPTQDVLLAMWKALPAHVCYGEERHSFRLDWPEADIKPWLAHTAENVCKARERAVVRYSETLANYERALAVDLAGSGCGLSTTELSDLRDVLEVGLRQLSARNRAIVEDRYFSDLTFEQIAAKHGIAISTVKNVLTSCLRCMRIALEREEQSRQ